jgi:hypothetical protein
MRVGGQRVAVDTLPPGNISGTYYTGCWLGLTGLDEFEKSRPKRGSNPEPSRPYLLRYPDPHVNG